MLIADPVHPHLDLGSGSSLDYLQAASIQYRIATKHLSVDGQGRVVTSQKSKPDELAPSYWGNYSGPYRADRATSPRSRYFTESGNNCIVLTIRSQNLIVAAIEYFHPADEFARFGIRRNASVLAHCCRARVVGRGRQFQVAVKFCQQ